MNKEDKREYLKWTFTAIIGIPGLFLTGFGTLRSIHNEYKIPMENLAVPLALLVLVTLFLLGLALRILLSYHDDTKKTGNNAILRWIKTTLEKQKILIFNGLNRIRSIFSKNREERDVMVHIGKYGEEANEGPEIELTMAILACLSDDDKTKTYKEYGQHPNSYQLISWLNEREKRPILYFNQFDSYLRKFNLRFPFRGKTSLLTDLARLELPFWTSLADQAHASRLTCIFEGQFEGIEGFNEKSPVYKVQRSLIGPPVVTPEPKKPRGPTFRRILTFCLTVLFIGLAYTSYQVWHQTLEAQKAYTIKSGSPEKVTAP